MCELNYDTFYKELQMIGPELIKIIILERHSIGEIKETLFHKYKNENLRGEELAEYIYRKYICREIGI